MFIFKTMTMGHLTARRGVVSGSPENGLTELEMADAIAWARRRRASGIAGCDRLYDHRGAPYLSVYDGRGEELFLLGRQDRRCFADQVWTFSTLAEGETLAEVLATLDRVFPATVSATPQSHCA